LTLKDVKERLGGRYNYLVKNKTAILSATERKSQFELMVKTDAAKAESIRKQIINLLAPFKPEFDLISVKKMN
jgi:IS30 family transposase